MEQLLTPRLLIRDVTAVDLVDILPVMASNWEFRLMTEGSGGVPGFYDLEMLRRDWVIAQHMPGRHMVAGWRRTGERTALVVADYMEASPYDGLPWLGLIEVHRAFQGRGYGTEVVRALAAHFRQSMGWRSVRAAVSSKNERGLAFAERNGFVRYGSVTRRSPSGPEELILLEKNLSDER